MLIALVKIDYGIRGGFELVLDEVTRGLTAAGHDVRRVDVPANQGRRPFGRAVSQERWQDAPEYFSYMGQVQACRELDLRRADVVVSSQPPTFMTPHERHLSIFFHHARSFYDLADVKVRAGMFDPAVHAAACEAVQSVDETGLRHVSVVLAGGETVRDRLVEYGFPTTRLGLFHAGPIGPAPSEGGAFEHVLCVSRHEFPKRTELFVHAMKLLPDVGGVAVGAGGRLGHVQQLDRDLSTAAVDRDLDPEGLWLREVPWLLPVPTGGWTSNVRFTGHATEQELDHLYRDALCVVAPALLEDYGLTALEAMRHGKPLIVCRDGGHLTHFVEDGESGFVVDPSGPAIAAAVRTLADDRALSERMGKRAREIADAYTWDRAHREVADGIERVLS